MTDNMSFDTDINKGFDPGFAWRNGGFVKLAERKRTLLVDYVDVPRAVIKR